MWSHQTDPTAAGILWSGRQAATCQDRSQLDEALRLAEMRERLVLRGGDAAVVQEPFCTEHVPSEWM